VRRHPAQGRPALARGAAHPPPPLRVPDRIRHSREGVGRRDGAGGPCRKDHARRPRRLRPSRAAPARQPGPVLLPRTPLVDRHVDVLNPRPVAG
jgi:hypothetical protein